MRKDLYKEHFEIESKHWWHWGKKKVVFGLISKYIKQNKITSLDVGCGVGVMVDQLSKLGSSYGIDSSPDAIKFAKLRGVKNVRESFAEKIDYKSETFDLVTALDVLEHTSNDKLVIKEIKRVLIRNGVLIITVPAYELLWSYWDEMLRHKRRYEKNELEKLLKSNGFKIIKLSYSNFFIFMPVIIFRMLKKMFSGSIDSTKSDFLETPRFLNPFFKLIYAFEGFWIRNFYFPFGLSIICVAKRKA